MGAVESKPALEKERCYAGSTEFRAIQSKFLADAGIDEISALMHLTWHRWQPEETLLCSASCIGQSLARDHPTSESILRRVQTADC